MVLDTFVIRNAVRVMWEGISPDTSYNRTLVILAGNEESDAHYHTLKNGSRHVEVLRTSCTDHVTCRKRWCEPLSTIFLAGKGH